MALGIRALAEELREIAFGSITGSYQAVGSATGAPARIVEIFNGMDEDLYLSLDGTTNHFRLFAGSGLVLDLCANQNFDKGMFLAEQTTFYVKEANTPSSGSLAISVIYAKGDT